MGKQFPLGLAFSNRKKEGKHTTNYDVCRRDVLLLHEIAKSQIVVLVLFSYQPL